MLVHIWIHTVPIVIKMHPHQHFIVQIQVEKIPKHPPLLYFPLQNYFARNFYNMRLLALFVAFAINFILLFYKVRMEKDSSTRQNQILNQRH